MLQDNLYGHNVGCSYEVDDNVM